MGSSSPSQRGNSVSSDWESVSSTDTDHSSLPYLCDDFGHCGAGVNLVPPQLCDPMSRHFCPGLQPNTPPSLMGNIIHPHPNNVEICGHCRAHQHQSKINQVEGHAGNNAWSGWRAQLCHNCIQDEMELYWLRRRPNQNRPAGPISWTWIEQWPTNANGIQNLCVCNTTSIAPFTNHCHACRDHAYFFNSQLQAGHAEDILRRKTTDVITGKKRCTSNGGTLAHNISQAVRAQRRNAGFRRMCPCGRKPKASLGADYEYITFCLGCSGVRVNPVHLPVKYRQAAIEAGLRRRATLRRPRGLSNTKGPGSLARNHLFRANIECGWMAPHDPWIGRQV